MLIFVVRRLGTTVLMMVVMSLLIFLLLELFPGDVAVKVLGPYSSEEQRQIWLEENGYNRPLYVRYFSWLGGFLTGDFGESIRFKVPVSEVLFPRLANTGILALATLVVVVPLSLALGVLAGMREGSRLDRTISVTSIVTTSVPEFASAVLLSAIFVFYLDLLPGTSGMIGGFNLTEVMTTHYIRTAVLKGLPYKTVILRHALRNALIAPFTVIMLQINWLLSGVIVVEFYFAYKGFGALLLEGALNNDIFVIEACAMVAVFVAVATQTIADIGYTYLNPRIRFS